MRLRSFGYLLKRVYTELVGQQSVVQDTRKGECVASYQVSKASVKDLQFNPHREEQVGFRTSDTFLTCAGLVCCWPRGWNHSTLGYTHEFKASACSYSSSGIFIQLTRALKGFVAYLQGLVLAVDWHPTIKDRLASGSRDGLIKVQAVEDAHYLTCIEGMGYICSRCQQQSSS